MLLLRHAGVMAFMLQTYLANVSTCKMLVISQCRGVAVAPMTRAKPLRCMASHFLAQQNTALFEAVGSAIDQLNDKSNTSNAAEPAEVL